MGPYWGKLLAPLTSGPSAEFAIFPIGVALAPRLSNTGSSGRAVAAIQPIAAAGARMAHRPGSPAEADLLHC